MIDIKKWIRSFKLTIPVEYDVSRQREWVSDVKISNKQVRAIVTDYFDKMDYKERQAWINSNAKVLNRRLGHG